MKRCSTLWIMYESCEDCISKSQWDTTSHSLGWLWLKQHTHTHKKTHKQKITSVVRNNKKLTLVLCWWGCKWCSHCEKHTAVPQNIKNRITIWSRCTTLGVYNQNNSKQELGHLYIHIHIISHHPQNAVNA